MTDTSVMNYALTSASAGSNSNNTSSSSTTNSMAAAAAFYQQQAAASAALASLDPTSSHHHQPLATAAAASALANVDTPRYPWMSITGKRGSFHTLESNLLRLLPFELSFLYSLHFSLRHRSDPDEIIMTCKYLLTQALGLYDLIC